MFRFVSESEELWHSILISFPSSLNMKSSVERSWMMRKNLDLYKLFEFDQIEQEDSAGVLDDFLNIVYLLNKLCHVGKVIKRISIDFRMKMFLNMGSRLQVLKLPQIEDPIALLNSCSTIFESLEELLLIPNNPTNISIDVRSRLHMKRPFRNLRHLVIDTDFVYCIDLIQDHISTLEYLTFINNQNNFKTFYSISLVLLEWGIIESEMLKSVEFIGSNDMKYLDLIQKAYTTKYGIGARKYLAKMKNMSIFQFTDEVDLGHPSNEILISNMVELTLVQFQGGNALNLSHMHFPNLKILNIKGCMQPLILKGMEANSLASLQLRMFELSEASSVFYALKFLTIDNCKGFNVSSWFNQHEKLKSFKIIISNKMETSLETMEMNFIEHSSIISISVTGCENVNISHCKNLEEIYIIDCKQTNISTKCDESNKGIKILEIENTNNQRNSTATLDISYCFYMAFNVSDEFDLKINGMLRVEHLDLLNISSTIDSIKDQLEISNIYITGYSSDSILSVINTIPVKKQIGIAHLSKRFTPIYQFECPASEITSNIISSALNNQQFDNSIQHVICNNNTESIIQLGEGVSMLCFDSILKTSNTLFINVKYLSIGTSVSEFKIDLSELPNLTELASSCHATSLKANKLTHQHLRSMVLANSVTINFYSLKAPKLIRFIVRAPLIQDCPIEIEYCDFPSLVLHSPQIKDKYTNEKVNSLDLVLNNFKKLTEPPTTSGNKYCNIM